MEGLCENVKEITKHFDPRNLAKNLKHVPLEAALREARGVLGFRIFGVLKSLEGGVPNPNHEFMAKLTKAGVIDAVLTTNLDVLLEEALKLERIKYVRHVCESDFKISREDKFHIFKLHGTVDRTRTVMVTLDQVGKGLTKCKRNVLEHFLKNRYVMFVGYGGGDRFDILPVLRRTEGKGVIWVKHVDGADYEILDRPMIESKTKKDMLDQLLCSLRTKTVLKISCDTKRLVDDLAMRSAIELTTPETEGEKVIKEKKSWAAGIPHTQRLHALGNLMLYASKFDVAKIIYGEYLQRGQKLRNKRTIADAHRYLGFTSWRAGDTGPARQNLNQALASLREVEKNAELIGWIEDDLSLVDWYDGWPLKALYHSQQSLQHKRHVLKRVSPRKKSKVLASYAGSLNDIGLAYINLGNLREALKLFRRGLRIKEKIHDLWGKAVILGNIGLIYTERSKFGLAFKYWKDALKLRDDIGDFWQVAIAYHGLARTWLGQGSFDRATQYCSMALELSKSIGDVRGIESSKCLMGRILMEKGRGVGGKAELIDQAEKLLCEVKDSKVFEIKAAAQRHLACIERDRGNLQDAGKIFSNMLLEVEKRNFVIEKTYLLKEYGLLLAKADRRKEAKSCLTKAQRLFSKLPNLFQKREVLKYKAMLKRN